MCECALWCFFFNLLVDSPTAKSFFFLFWCSILSSFQRVGFQKRDLWLTNKLERRHTVRFYLPFRVFSCLSFTSLWPFFPNLNVLYSDLLCFWTISQLSSKIEQDEWEKIDSFCDSASSEQKRIHGVLTCSLPNRRKKPPNRLDSIESQMAGLLTVALQTHTHTGDSPLKLRLTLAKTAITIAIELPIHSAMCHLYCNVTNADILDVEHWDSFYFFFFSFFFGSADQTKNYLLQLEWIPMNFHSKKLWF